MNTINPEIGRNRHLQYLVLTAIAVLFPFFHQVSSILIFIVFVLWLVEGKFAAKWKIFSHRPANWIMIGFFIIHALSLLYSDTSSGLAIVERRMSLLAFPIILGSTIIPHSVYRNICYAFTGSVVVCSLIAVGNGIFLALALNTSDVLFYHQLVDVLGLSAIFMSYLVTFSILVLLHFGIRRWSDLNAIRKWGVGITLLWLLIFLVLLSSKMFLFINYLLFCIYLLYLFGRKHWRKSVVSILAFHILIIVLILFLPQTRERIERAVNTDMEVITLNEYQDNTDFTGLSLRLVFWRLSIEILNKKEAWVAGVGVGDAQSVLNEEYLAYNMYTGNPELGDKGYIDFNTHSQYVQLLLELGIVGVLFWLLLLFYSLIRAIRLKLILPSLFILIMIFFGITEAFLDRHIGIVFFCFFYYLLFYNSDVKSGRGKI